MLELDPIFTEGGALSRTVPGFRARPFQLDMARAVESAIADRTVLVAEAGTGTGKTFAYLVPALRSGGKVIVSTGTKTLQDQLFDRDIPTVRHALKVPVTVALLKGRPGLSFADSAPLAPGIVEPWLAGDGSPPSAPAIEVARWAWLPSVNSVVVLIACARGRRRTHPGVAVRGGARAPPGASAASARGPSSSR